MSFGDIRLNMVFDNGFCRCHGALDIARTPYGDIARVTNPLECIYQRIGVWASEVHECYDLLELTLEHLDILKASGTYLDALVAHALQGGRLLGNKATGVETSLEATNALKDISVARDGSLFVIFNSDGTLRKWSGTAWGSALGAETGIKAIAAKSGTMVWAIASDDTLHYWNGLTWIQSSTETVSGIALANL